MLSITQVPHRPDPWDMSRIKWQLANVGGAGGSAEGVHGKERLWRRLLSANAPGPTIFLREEDDGDHDLRRAVCRQIIVRPTAGRSIQHIKHSPNRSDL